MAIGDSLGDAWIEVHADTGPFDRELAAGVREGAESAEAEKSLSETGKKFGKEISDSTSKEIKKHGKDIAQALEKATEGHQVRFRGRFNFLQRLRDRRGTARNMLDTLEKDMEQILTSEAGGNGLFGRVGQGIRDAIGAGFNISGKSPLITVLVPVIGAIVALVLAALQAVNLLAAGLAALPALLAAIGLQVGVLYLAFRGLGTAIGAAFQAKNAKELKEALKDLQPSAQEFVKALLPLKQIFKDLIQISQFYFFFNLGTKFIKEIEGFLGGEQFKRGVGALASSLGIFFQQLGNFFASADFRKFILDIFPSTVQFLSKFGPSFVVFMKGLINVADAALPFLNRIGVQVGNLLEIIGGFFTRVSKDKSLAKWLDSMDDTFSAIVELLGEATGFLITFLAELDKAGGKEIITAFADAFEQLTFVLASPVGEKFMKGLVNFSIFAVQSITGLIELLIGFVALIQWLSDTGFPDLGRAILEFLQFIGKTAVDIVSSIASPIIDFVNFVIELFTKLWHTVSSRFTDFITTIRDTIVGLPGRVVDWAKGLAGALINSGKNLIRGLINGIKSTLPDLSGVLGWITDHLPDWKGPEDKDLKILQPSGEAVMQGFAKGLKIGAVDVRSLLADMTNSLGTMRTSNQSVTFGPNSIQMKFYGPTPTESQAMVAGSAVGAGINGQLASRNARLSVREM